MDLLKITVYLSLIIQIFTGLFDYYVIQIDVPENIIILQQLLVMELIVQIIEGIFYVWLAFNIASVANITPHRYYDWYLTTPTMLVTLCIYLDYLKDRANGIITTTSLFENIYKHLFPLTIIIFLNFVMLTSGYLTEIKKFSQVSGVLFGFIPFLLYFYIIYEYFAKFSLQTTYMFQYFFIVWFLYGIAALMPYKWKNICYNILDLFAKNFFGIYLGFVILQSL